MATWSWLPQMGRKESTKLNSNFINRKKAIQLHVYSAIELHGWGALTHGTYMYTSVYIL